METSMYRIFKVEDGVKTVLGLTFIPKDAVVEYLNRVGGRLVSYGAIEVIGLEAKQ